MIDAVPGGEHVGQVGPHAGVDRDRALDAERGPGLGRQGSLGPHPDDHEDHIGGAGHGGPVGRGGLDFEVPGLSGRGPGDGLNGGAGQHLDAAGGELGVHEGA